MKTTSKGRKEGLELCEAATPDDGLEVRKVPEGHVVARVFTLEDGRRATSFPALFSSTTEPNEANAALFAHARTGYPAALSDLEAALGLLREAVDTETDGVSGDLWFKIDAFLTEADDET